MNNFIDFTKSTFNGIKTIASYSFQWLAYIVTLGHAEYPRVKSDKHPSPVTGPTRLQNRKVVEAERKREVIADEFFGSLKKIYGEDHAINFLLSPEYKAYLDDTNAFASIKYYYQKYVARGFLETIQDKDAFMNSPEFNRFLISDPINPSDTAAYNPFATQKIVVAETIDQVYAKYQASIAQQKEEKLQAFTKDVQRFFIEEEGVNDPESEVKKAFMESKTYTDLVDRLGSDLSFSPTLADVKRKYKEYKENLPLENQKLLDRFKDKYEFMSSYEYKSISKKEILLPKHIIEAHNNYQKRIERETAINAYMESLKKDMWDRFDDFIASKEYKNVIQNPFHSLEALKNGVEQFEKRNFIENLPDTDKAFLQSEPYKEITAKQFATSREITDAYKNFRLQKENEIAIEREKYLETLKAQLKKETGNDDYYNKFLASKEFREVWLSTIDKTAENVKQAYENYQTNNPRPWGWFGF